MGISSSKTGMVNGIRAEVKQVSPGRTGKYRAAFLSFHREDLNVFFPSKKRSQAWSMSNLRLHVTKGSGPDKLVFRLMDQKSSFLKIKGHRIAESLRMELEDFLEAKKQDPSQEQASPADRRAEKGSEDEVSIDDRLISRTKETKHSGMAEHSKPETECQGMELRHALQEDQSRPGSLEQEAGTSGASGKFDLIKFERSENGGQIPIYDLPDQDDEESTSREAGTSQQPKEKNGLQRAPLPIINEEPEELILEQVLPGSFTFRRVADMEPPRFKMMLDSNGAIKYVSVESTAVVRRESHETRVSYTDIDIEKTRALRVALGIVGPK